MTVDELIEMVGVELEDSFLDKDRQVNIRDVEIIKEAIIHVIGRAIFNNEVSLVQ